MNDSEAHFATHNAVFASSMTFIGPSHAAHFNLLSILCCMLSSWIAVLNCINLPIIVDSRNSTQIEASLKQFSPRSEFNQVAAAIFQRSFTQRLNANVMITIIFINNPKSIRHSDFRLLVMQAEKIKVRK